MSPGAFASRLGALGHVDIRRHSPCALACKCRLERKARRAESSGGVVGEGQRDFGTTGITGITASRFGMYYADNSPLIRRSISPLEFALLCL